MNRFLVSMGAAVVGLAAVVAPAMAAGGDEHSEKAKAMVAKAIGYLKSKQDPATGGWNVPPAEMKKPNFPAITGLVVIGMVGQEGADQKDPAIAAATKYMLSFKQPDGGIYDKTLPSYNTSIVLSALSKLDPPTPEAKAAIKPAQEFLRKLQWSEASDPAVGGPEAGKPVDKSHPYYGGIGYGSGGRPDMSNLAFMLQAFKDSGVAADDVAFQRAVVFLQRCQMDGAINDQDYAKGSKQGGFIYSTSESKDKVGSGESKAPMLEETMDDGTKVSRLRAYGSMTYAGFKSYLYANLPKEDRRVTEALRWIRANYSVEENPGMGNSGLYYYFVTFSRALEAWGETNLDVQAGGAPGGPRPAAGTKTANWKHDLIDRLVGLQNEDGSFKTLDPRWMENDPVLITAYAVMALEAAGR